MNDLFVLAAHNTIVALVLALFVYGLTRAGAIRRSPTCSGCWFFSSSWLRR